MKNKSLIISLIFLPFIFYSIYWIFFPLFLPFTSKQTVLISSTLGTIITSFTFWIILKNISNPIVTKALFTGITSSTIMFILGFISPMIFTPDANQGPLLGFILAPIGFSGGALLGGIYWYFKLKKQKRFPIK